MTVRVVDDRTFLLSLDEQYRSIMKRHESDELLHQARAVARTLAVQPAEGPVEGYYVEREELREYFGLMRALQLVHDSRKPEVEKLAAYRRLIDVTSSPLFGVPVWEGKLLPAGQDPLTVALESTAMSDWSIPTLTTAAHRAVTESEDCSLVGLAAYTRDPVVITALRESVVLYAAVAYGSAPRVEEWRYEWRVDAELARRAARFVETFNRLFPSGRKLPAVTSANAEGYWNDHNDRILGRCVRIGKDGSGRHYHWAVRWHAASAPNGVLEADDFWDTQLWTSERYRESARCFAGADAPAHHN